MAKYIEIPTTIERLKQVVADYDRRDFGGKRNGNATIQLVIPNDAERFTEHRKIEINFRYYGETFHSITE